MKLTDIGRMLINYTGSMFSRFATLDYLSDKERDLSSYDALKYPPIWFGVDKISSSIAQMPIVLYRKKERGSDKVIKHPVAKLMRRPNKSQTSFAFFRQLMLHAMLDGNGRAAVVRDESGRPIELIPLNPMYTLSIVSFGEKYHVTRPPEWDRLRLFFNPMNEEQARQKEGIIVIDDKDVVHILGLSEDGIQGIPLRKVGAPSIRAGLNAQNRVCSQMEKGFSGRLFFQVPTGVLRSKTEIDEFLEHVKKRHAGAKGDDVGVLREGITANVIDMNNQEAEMAATRLFQRQDASLLLGLESMPGDHDSVSYNSAEQKALAFIQMLGKWVTQIEQEFEFKLLTPAEYDRKTYILRAQPGVLLKTDMKTSAETIAGLVRGEIITPNEGREKLDMNPIEGGDTLRNPAITPATPGTSTEPKPTNQTMTPLAARRNEISATQSRISHMIGVESRNVANAAKKATDKKLSFIDWVGDFYSKKWEPKFADCVEEFGIDRNEASKHCLESKRRLLDVAKESTTDKLGENVASCVADWKNRATTILGVMSDV